MKKTTLSLVVFAAFSGEQSFATDIVPAATTPTNSTSWSTSNTNTNGVMDQNPYDYSGLTYNWSEGETEKTAKITDKATTTSQIIALFKTVYTNKSVPGTYYAFDYDKNGYIKRGEVDYTNSGIQVSSWLDHQNYKPTLDGKSVILIQVKDDWTVSQWDDSNPYSDEEFVNKAMASAQLLDKSKYIYDPINPGWLFSINDVSTNRFYFISKGETRTFDRPPFYRTFEELSPTLNDNGDATDNFVDIMKQGVPYPMVHNCGSVPITNAGDYFTISSDGTNYSLKNMCIFIPDRRFEGDRLAWVFYDKADPKYQPRSIMYVADLDVQGEPIAGDDDNYRINLSWNTNFTQENIGLNIPQHYYVYQVNGDKRTLLAEITEQPTRSTSFSYTVPKQDEGQEFRYVVVATPINSDITAETPIRLAQIPGRKPFFVQADEYRSRYDMANEVNRYKNTMSIAPSTPGNYATIKNNANMNYTLTRTDDKGTVANVANIEFVANDDNNTYNFTVYYNPESQDLLHLFDNTVPSTRGTLTSVKSNVTIVDRFTASTANNAQSAKYTYNLVQGEELYSNTCNVAVCKTTNITRKEGLPKIVVDNDIDHSSEVFNVNSITFEASYRDEDNITKYEVWRDDEYTVIGKSENMGTGKYNSMIRSENGVLQKSVGTKTVNENDNTITLSDETTDAASTPVYVPVVTSLCNGDASKPNTYGCNIMQVSHPTLHIVVDELEKTKSFYKTNGPAMGFGATIHIIPNVTEEVPNVYYYRVWRKVGNRETEVLLNNLEDESGSNADGQQLWGSTYSHIQRHYPSSSTETTVRDIYIDEPLNDESRNVNYIVRMYSTNVSESENSNNETTTPQKAITISANNYYVNEQTETVEYNDEIVTALNDVQISATPLQITYINALGISSDKPFQGVNIKVTRYTDGSIQKSKMVK